jgi:hypothetical protein
MVSVENPALSVVVAIVSDTTGSQIDLSHLARCLEALHQQVDPPSMEIIVPHLHDLKGIEELHRQFPQVVFLPVSGISVSPAGGSREHHDQLRARGLALARGEIVGLLEDHARPDQNWCGRVVRAHTNGYGAIGGAIENGIDRVLNWAVYYCDFGKYQNPVPSGESTFASDANVSYKRSALQDVQSVWAQAFHETVVNSSLMSRGQKLALRPDIIVYQHRDNLQLGSALRERFIWGRSYAATRSVLVGKAKRAIYAALSPVLPAVLVLRMVRTAWAKRSSFSKFLKSLPLIVMLLASWSVGELVGYLTGRPD